MPFKFWWPFDGVQTTSAGLALLLASLIERHFDQPDMVLVAICSWAGALCVIVGVGQIFLLEQD